MTNFQLSILFFFELAVILVVCRVVGMVARRLGQTQVVGEMIAGVLLGPSLFGVLAPATHERLFPSKSASMSILYAAAQLGLVLYMFLVGVEFRAEIVRQRLRSAASISLAGMIVPFALGCGLAAWFIRDHELFVTGLSVWTAMLYLGAAMAITAFPVLARIIRERGLTGTPVGTLALAAGSMDDAAAWCVLAVVLATFQSDARIAVAAICGGAAYALLAVAGLRKWLRPFGHRVERLGQLSEASLTFVLILLMLAAWFTDFVGIHAVFGAFVLGTVMPRGVVSRELERMIGPLTTCLLVPLFFVYSGLNTRIDLVNTGRLWALAGVVLLAACLGKGVACWAAARFHGETPREAVAIGALMNARGLMELIILNIGLEKGIITPQLFSMMVVMAIVTTLMATPIFELALGRRRTIPDPSALE